MDPLTIAAIASAGLGAYDMFFGGGKDARESVKADQEMARKLAQQAVGSYKKAQGGAQRRYDLNAPLRNAFRMGAMKFGDTPNPFSRGNMFLPFMENLKQEGQPQPSGGDGLSDSPALPGTYSGGAGGYHDDPGAPDREDHNYPGGGPGPGDDPIDPGGDPNNPEHPGAVVFDSPVATGLSGGGGPSFSSPGGGAGVFAQPQPMGGASPFAPLLGGGAGAAAQGQMGGALRGGRSPGTFRGGSAQNRQSPNSGAPPQGPQQALMQLLPRLQAAGRL